MFDQVHHNSSSAVVEEISRKRRPVDSAALALAAQRKMMEMMVMDEAEMEMAEASRDTEQVTGHPHSIWRALLAQ